MSTEPVPKSTSQGCGAARGCPGFESTTMPGAETSISQIFFFFSRPSGKGINGNQGPETEHTHFCSLDDRRGQSSPSKFAIGTWLTLPQPFAEDLAWRAHKKFERSPVLRASSIKEENHRRERKSYKYQHIHTHIGACRRTHSLLPDVIPARFGVKNFSKC